MALRLLALAVFAVASVQAARAADPIDPVGFPKKGDPGGGVGAFRIWFADGEWHLRTSTENSVGKKDKIMVFTGSVRTEAKMTVEGNRLEKGNGKTSDSFTVHADGKGFDFTFKTYGAIDQVDFKVPEAAKALKFKLLLDGEKAPTIRIIIGADGAHPEKNEFTLPAHPKKEK
jgi:GH43 family beta-xylosidase